MAPSAFDAEHDGPPPMAEINTTPLVDVMLVLLVIFIITAPLFQQAIPIDLPRVDSTRLDNRPRVLSVAIDADGTLFLDGASMAIETFAAQATQAVADRGRDASPPELHLRAHRDTRYERVAEVMAVAQRAGLVKIAFVTERP